MPEQIYIDDLIGKPFAEEGRGPDCFNCWSLCQAVYKRIDIELPDRDYIYDVEQRTKTIEAGRADFIELAEPQPFCIVCFRLAGELHLGVVLADCRRFIQCSRTKGVCIERLSKYTKTGGCITDFGYFKYGKPIKDSAG